MNLLLALLQALLLLALAPLLQGVIKQTKAWLQGRQGPPILQPYRDLRKFFWKETVVSDQSTWLSRATPYIYFTATLAAGLLLPTVAVQAPLPMAGDLIVLLGLLAAARFWLATASLDSSSHFGGMGASRELALAVFVEPALLLGALALLVPHGTLSVGAGVQAQLAAESPLGPAQGLALLAMLVVMCAETGRIPIDNPDTHLELTMFHEGMLLEFSGRHLGLLTWAAEVKQLIILTLVTDLFLPWGAFDPTSIATPAPVVRLLLAGLLYLVKLGALGVLLALIETLLAKVRILKVPEVLGSSVVFSLLALLAGFVFRG